MVKLALVAALLTAAPGVAQARQWFVVSLDGNRCLDWHEMQQETAMSGSHLLFITPQQLMINLHYVGVVPKAKVFKLPYGQEAAVISWQGPIGQTLERVFYTDRPDCEAAVKRAIDAGNVPSADDLR